MIRHRNRREGTALDSAQIYQALQDKAGFAALYREMGRPLYIVIYRIVHSKEMAEDLMQDLFVRLYAQPPSSSVKNLRAYIFQMARNLAIDALRRERTQEYEEPTVWTECEERLDIERAMAQLPPVQCQAVTLHINAGFGFAQIAQILGVSVPTAWRYYRKGLEGLRDMLEE